MPWPSRHPDLGLLILRLGLAFGFLWNGITKFLPLTRTIGFFESIGAPVPAVSATLNASIETIAGILLLLGLRVELAGALILLDLLVVLTPINLGAGYVWWQDLAIKAAAALAIILIGPGRYRWRGRAVAA